MASKIVMALVRPMGALLIACTRLSDTSCKAVAWGSKRGDGSVEDPIYRCLLFESFGARLWHYVATPDTSRSPTWKICVSYHGLLVSMRNANSLPERVARLEENSESQVAAFLNQKSVSRTSRTSKAATPDLARSWLPFTSGNLTLIGSVSAF